jgi:glycosyltransferase involved in cell wall biosynthesis
VCKLSIVIPTYNCAPYIDEALKSIFRQSFTDREIIIVDDGSTDDTGAVVGKYEGRVRYLYQANSGGASKPRNEGIRQSRGEYIAIFDSDDIMLDGKLDFQVRFLDNHPEVDFVFTDFCNFQASNIYPKHTTTCSLFKELLRLKAEQEQYVIGKEEGYNALFLENYIGTSSIMFRKQLIEKTGFFDETLRIGEDIDFFFRVLNVSDMGYIDRVCHTRRIHSTSMMSRTEMAIADPIRAYEKQLDTAGSGESRRNLKKQIGHRYYALGYYYRSQGQFSDSMGAFLKGSMRVPLNFRLYSGLLKSAGLLLWQNAGRQLK